MGLHGLDRRGINPLTVLKYVKKAANRSPFLRLFESAMCHSGSDPEPESILQFIEFIN